MKAPFKWNSKPVALLALLCLAPVHGRTDSLWSDAASPLPFADKKALSVGDIINVIVQETNSNQKEQSTKTAKESTADVGVSSFLFSPANSGLLTKGGAFPALKFSSANDFTGGGSIKNTDNITTRFGARVVEVLPNRNLVVEAMRQTGYGRENQTIILRGVLRADDVTSRNEVYSYQLADLSLRFHTDGSLSDSQKKGWFTQFFEKINPF
jgi:flagellar L-ring protein precursor FlgH